MVSSRLLVVVGMMLGGASFPALCPTLAQTHNTSVRPGQEWLDTSGRPIQAHGFSVVYDHADQCYYWYGEDKTYTTEGSHVWTWGIRCYRSKNFYNWEDCGHLLFPDTTNVLSPTHYSQGLDRPHIIYNKKTGKWVCWFKNLDDHTQFFTVLTADRFLGPYKVVVPGFRPNGYEAGDFDLYVDEDTDKAYVWFERPHWELMCMELSDDYLGVIPSTLHPIPADAPTRSLSPSTISHHYVGRRPPFTREAPTHFVRNGKHYLFTSGTSGYYPNESLVSMFSDYHGEYQDLGNPHSTDTTHTSFFSQITDVIKIPGRKDLYVAVADRWMPQIVGTDAARQEQQKMIEKYRDHQPNPITDAPVKIVDRSKQQRHGWDVTSNARYVFLPIVWKGDKPEIEWRDEWRIEDYEDDKQTSNLKLQTSNFRNPVIWADLPDPDVIRVDDTFYFVSTSMHFFPGVTILQSKDLVNWEIATNVVDEFKEHPAYDMQGGTRYAKGQWATSLSYFGGEFHVLFNTNTEGSFIYSSKTMAGPWRKTKVEGHKLYDPGMFVDTDGRVYVVHGNTDIFVTEMDPVTLQERGPARQIYKSHRGGLEGNRCYHIGDYYYIYCTYGGEHAGQTCLRSRSLYGPWEEREVMFEWGNMAEYVLHQSCIIPLSDGTYWGMIFQDRGGLGRIPWLIPIYWVNDWPLMGDPTDGIMTLKAPLSLVGRESVTASPLSGSDDFSQKQLAPMWQWNHNPDRSRYSLTERKGWLRLKAATVTDSLWTARNTLCQRIIGPYSQATTKIDFSHMKLGDRAGLCVLAWPYAALQIERTTKGFSLSMMNHEQVKQTVSLKGKQVWLRADVDGITDLVRFSYSTDGKTFTPIGTSFKMLFDTKFFCGNRYGLYNYATKRLGGYIDIDDIQIEQRPLFSRDIKAGTTLEAEWFDHSWNAECSWSALHKEGKNQDVTFTHDGGMIAFCDLTIEGGISGMTLTLRNHDAVNTFIEVKNIDTGGVLGTADVPAPSADYQEVRLPLSRPLPTKINRLEIRCWNRNWNQLSMGRVSIDKITFTK